MNISAKNTHGVIRFSLKESVKKLELTPKKQSLIMLHFSSKGDRFKKSTGFKCSLNQWDVQKQKVKTGKGMMNNAYAVNNFLGSLEAFSEEKISEMKKEFGYINIKLLSDSISSFIKGDNTKKQELTLVSYAESLATEKKNHISNATWNTYNQLIEQLKIYEDYYKATLTFESIDMSFYRNFKFLLEKNDFRLNTIGKHIKNLKAVLNEALVNGLTKNLIFKSKNFKVLKEETTEIYLTKDEIKILDEEDLSSNPTMELARDIFLIGCYTGQRVSDYNGITENNIVTLDGNKYIKIIQKKNDTVVHIPITNQIKKIMSRYNNNFPPKMSEPTLRKNIKELCRKVGFDELVYITYTKGGKKAKKGVPKYQLVKTHTARRSFCTNHYKDGKSIQNIMLFSGHSTEKDFYKYIRLKKEQKAVAVFESGFFN